MHALGGKQRCQACVVPLRQAKAAEGRLTVVDTLALEPAKTVCAGAMSLLPFFVVQLGAAVILQGSSLTTVLPCACSESAGQTAECPASRCGSPLSADGGQWQAGRRRRVSSSPAQVSIEECLLLCTCFLLLFQDCGFLQRTVLLWQGVLAERCFKPAMD